MAPAVKKNWYLWFKNFFVYKNQKRSYILRYNHVLLMNFDNANRHYSCRIIEKFFVGQGTRFFLQVQNRWQEQGIKSTRNRMISKRGKWVTTSCNNHHQLGPPPRFLSYPLSAPKSSVKSDVGTNFATQNPRNKKVFDAATNAATSEERAHNRQVLRVGLTSATKF